MKHTKIFKRHYDYREFDTNIPEYVAFVVQTMRSKSDQCCNIVNDFIEYLHTLSCKCSYQMMYNALYQNDYKLSDIKQYYNQLNDLIREHNSSQKVISYEMSIIDKKYRQLKDKLKSAMEVADKFGACEFENDDNKYIVSKYEKKKGKI